MTKQEAEREAELLNKRDPQWSCPLWRDKCHKDCINFIPAFAEHEDENSSMLHDIKDDNFTVGGFVCSNAMFIGSPSITCT